MALDHILERFAQQTPLTVVARAAREHALAPGAIDALFERAAGLPGYGIEILDGHHLAGAERRLKGLRAIGAGALPGKAPVVPDPRAMPVTDVSPGEGGRARERPLPGAVPEGIRPGEVGI